VVERWGALEFEVSNQPRCSRIDYAPIINLPRFWPKEHGYFDLNLRGHLKIEGKGLKLNCENTGSCQ
jgi:hypothetical protein